MVKAVFSIVVALVLFLPLPANGELVVGYLFDEGVEFVDSAEALGGGGTALDILKCRNVGYCAFVPGVFGNAMEVGFDSFMRTRWDSGDLDPGENGFTVAFWVFVAEYPEYSAHILGKSEPSSGGWSFRANPVEVTAVLKDFAAKYFLTVPVNILGSWRHLALTLSPEGEAVFYLDGEVVDSKLAAVSVNPDFLYLGCMSSDWTAFNQSFSGKIDDFGIWNEVLDPEAIARLVEVGIAEYMKETCPPVSGYVKDGGTAAPNVEVIYTNGTAEKLETTTDETGYFEFTEASVGAFTLQLGEETDDSDSEDNKTTFAASSGSDGGKCFISTSRGH